jgi:hypothetical protein
VHRRDDAGRLPYLVALSSALTDTNLHPCPTSIPGQSVETFVFNPDCTTPSGIWFYCFGLHLQHTFPNVDTTSVLPTVNHLISIPATMAFFTKFKKAKEAAVEHKKTAAAQDTKPPTAPYKHVPTHAAQDALNLQPTTLKPAELQARIAAARKRRASYSAYQSPMSARHSIYHSTDASRASSRAPSITLNPRSGAPSLKGKGPDEHSMDSVAKRARSQSYRHSSAMATPLTQAAEYFPQIPEGPLALPPPVASQRPRPPMSNRSSFAKKKSPLSNMAVDEGTLHKSPLIRSRS